MAKTDRPGVPVARIARALLPCPAPGRSQPRRPVLNDKPEEPQE